jgi:glycosyl transferase family 87
VEKATRISTLLFLAVLPVGLLAAFIAVGVTPGPNQAIDFRTFWDAAGTYVHHGNPYPVASHLTWASAQRSFYYPAPIAALLALLTALPYHAAAVAFVLLSAAAVIAGLRLLDVTDWRVYGAVIVSPAILTGISVGTLSPMLFLGVAACWRWRDRFVPSVICVGLVVLAKLFLWPLLVWLWFTGRRRVAVAAITLDLLASIVAWSWVGFAGLRDYPQILRAASSIEGHFSYAPISTIGRQPLALVGAVLAVAGVALAARRRSDGEAFFAAIILALLATPILWLHYLCLLAVVAILRPRFGWVWLLPVALWATPQQGAYGSGWREVTVVAVIGGVGSVCLAKLGSVGDDERVAVAAVQAGAAGVVR